MAGDTGRRKWPSAMSRRGRLAGASGALLLAVTLAACGGGDSAGNSSSTGQAATGTPISIGLMNTNTGAAPYPGTYQGAMAAIDYINKNAGGVNGHPLDVTFCSNDGTVNSSRGCAEQIVAKNPVAVLTGVDQGSPGSVPVFEKAKVPFIGGFPQYDVDKASDYGFFFQNAELGFVSIARFLATEKGAKKIGVLFIDVPSVHGFLAAMTDNLSKSGVEVVPLPTAPTSTDFSPQLAQAQASGIDAIVAIQAPSGTARAIQAKTTLGLNIPFGLPDAGANEATVAAGGSGAEGSYFFSGVVLPSDTEDPQVKTFTEAMKQYQPDVPVGVDQAVAFQMVVNLVEVMKQLPEGGVTSQAIVDKLRSSKDVPSFMGPTYSCDGKQANPGQIGICSGQIRIYQYVNGEFDVAQDWKQVNAS